MIAMASPNNPKFLCSGCSHELEPRNTNTDSQQYLSIDAMRSSGYHCNKSSCAVYIEWKDRETHGGNGQHTVSNTQASPRVPSKQTT